MKDLRMSGFGDWVTDTVDDVANLSGAVLDQANFLYEKVENFGLGEEPVTSVPADVVPNGRGGMKPAPTAIVTKNGSSGDTYVKYAFYTVALLVVLKVLKVI